MMLPHHLQLRRVSTLHQVRLHHQTSTTTLLHRLLHMGTSSKLYVFKRFWSLLTKGGEAYELIVFKRVHMGGCFTFATFSKCLQLSLLIHLVLWVVTLKLDGRLLLFLSTMWCDDKFRMCDDKFRTKAFCRRPFIIMHVIIFVISFHAWWIVFIS